MGFDSHPIDIWPSVALYGSRVAPTPLGATRISPPALSGVHRSGAVLVAAPPVVVAPDGAVVGAAAPSSSPQAAASRTAAIKGASIAARFMFPPSGTERGRGPWVRLVRPRSCGRRPLKVKGGPIG